MANQQKNGLIPGWMIVVGFMIGFWPGAILLGVRIAQESGLRGNNGQSSSTRTTYTSTRSTSQSEWARNARDVDYRTADRQDSAADGSPAEGREPRVYHPNQSANGGQNAQKSNTNGNYQYHYNYRYGNSGNSGKARSSGSLLDHPKLSAKRGKGLRLAGAITMGCGAFVAAIVMLGALSEGLFSHDFWIAMLGSLITAMTICTPGAVLNIVGARTNDRVMRCRTYAAMIGDRRSVDIDELAGAIPVSYKKCCADLNWMLGEGMLRGMYIDAGDRVLTYPDARKREEEKPAPAPVQVDGSGVKRYPEEVRIRQLNDEIEDEYVSQRMDRLEELTHKILAYAEEHPEKDASLRPFRSHYLPKTIKILESYARMERAGVENGGNIASAMKDVEDIMDKLVTGFEKQLDALFDSEAMDVTSEVSVLENMMNLEGLSDLDPFGTLKQDDELIKH